MFCPADTLSGETDIDALGKAVEDELVVLEVLFVVFVGLLAVVLGLTVVVVTGAITVNLIAPRELKVYSTPDRFTITDSSQLPRSALVGVPELAHPVKPVGTEQILNFPR